MPKTDPFELIEQGRHVGASDKTPMFNGLNAQLPNALFNDIEPQAGTTRQREKPEHRLMICLAANGFNITEISHRCDCSTVCVSNVLRQPWARARIIAMQQEAGMDELQRTLRTACNGAVARIIKRADMLNDVAPMSALAQDVDECIVNRYLGKATTKIEHSNKPVDKMTDAEIADLVRKFAVEQDVAAGVGQVELVHEGEGAA